jgi:hypothetical protein
VAQTGAPARRERNRASDAPTYLTMAAVDDEKRVLKLIYDLAKGGRLVELRALLKEHPDVDVNGYRDVGRSALFGACYFGHTECAQLLIDLNADVNLKSIYGTCALHAAASRGHLGCTKLLVQSGADVNCQDPYYYFFPLMMCAKTGHLNIAQYLIEQKADVYHRISMKGYRKNMDALFLAMRKEATNLTPGIAFAFSSCNTDAKNVKIDYYVTPKIRDDHIEHYQHVQAYIDEYHRILNLVLSEHVPVDPRFGLGQMGIYQEPLERTLEYLGLSMTKDQVVNTSIDGEAVRRALIPGHLLNANHWFDKYAKETQRDKLEQCLNELEAKHAKLIKEHEAKVSTLKTTIAALFP